MSDSPPKRPRRPRAARPSSARASTPRPSSEPRQAPARRARSRVSPPPPDPAASVPITHPEKVLFPAFGGKPAITKGELAAYYEAIAPVMLPHVYARPITMERYPAGIEQPGFIQKDVSKGFPAWLERIEAPKRDGVVHYPLVTDTRSLTWLANQNCITPHVWNSRAPDLWHPDTCVFDFDPADEDRDLDRLRRAALALRDLLASLSLESWIKTSGSKGFHIVISLDRRAGYDEVFRFASAVATTLIARHPDDLTQEFAKVDRAGRILVDIGRNGYSATVAAAYAVRPKPGAPVSAPCTWTEIERGLVTPRTFTLRAMPARLAEVGDLWADMAAKAAPLPPAPDPS